MREDYICLKMAILHFLLIFIKCNLQEIRNKGSRQNTNIVADADNIDGDFLIFLFNLGTF